MHPAITLFSIAQCLLAFLVPLIFGLMTYRAGKEARLWFTAGVFYSLYLVLLNVFPSKEFSLIRLVQITMLWLYIVALIHLLMREVRASSSWLFVPIAAGVPIIILSYLSALGFRLMEQVAASLMVVIGDATICALAAILMVRSRQWAFGLVAASGLLVALANLLRADELIFGSGIFSFTDFTWQSNFLVIGHLLAIVFLNIGWAGARFPETAHCATDRIDGGRAWTGRMGWNRV